MIRDGKKIRLTKTELNALRRDNARNGDCLLYTSDAADEE